MKKLIVVIVIIIVVGSLGYFATRGGGKFEHHGVIDEIHHYDHSKIHGDSTHVQHINEFDTTEFLKVHSKNPDIKPFFTQFRAEDIVSFPCQNCHNIPLSELSEGKSTVKKAHWNIELQHASGEIMNCMTCHNSNNMNQLISLSGHPISIDKSFELCAQCHSAQYQDWQGGAHGKSINGWQKPRAVKTCVNCHNPHSPAFEKRWPSRWVKEETNSK